MILSEQDKPVDLFSSLPVGVDVEMCERFCGIPVYDIDQLIANLAQYQVSYAGTGSRALVYRLRDTSIHSDMTIKVFLAENTRSYAELTALSRASGFNAKPMDFLFYGFSSPDDPDQEFIEDQVKGHVEGSQISPDYIDSPVCIWARKNNQGEVEKVGYSLPFIEGEAIKISDDSELCDVADMLKRSAGIYVGHRGGRYNDSCNAIVDEASAVKKFIDVRVIE
ncbi:MAG: hypothetical protein ACEQSA_01090 [Weeksellaceae bacterium]